MGYIHCRNGEGDQCTWQMKNRLNCQFLFVLVKQPPENINNQLKELIFGILVHSPSCLIWSYFQ